MCELLGFRDYVFLILSKIPAHEPFSVFYSIKELALAWLTKIIMSENMAEISLYSTVGIVFLSMAH